MPRNRHKQSKFKILIVNGWRSKTIWLGYLTIAFTGLQEVLHQFEVFIPTRVYTIAGSIIGALIVIARIVTKEPLADK